MSKVYCPEFYADKAIPPIRGPFQRYDAEPQNDQSKLYGIHTWIEISWLSMLGFRSDASQLFEDLKTFEGKGLVGYTASAQLFRRRPVLETFSVWQDRTASGAFVRGAVHKELMQTWMGNLSGIRRVWVPGHSVPEAGCDPREFIERVKNGSFEAVDTTTS
eukprot:jgi/Mesvir1/19026/Mv12791-RA.1